MKKIIQIIIFINIILLIGCENIFINKNNGLRTQDEYDFMASKIEVVNKEKVTAKVTKYKRYETSYEVIIEYKDYFIEFNDSGTYYNLNENEYIESYLYTIKEKETRKELKILSLDEKIDYYELSKIISNFKNM